MPHWKGISQRLPRFSLYWIGALIIIALAIAIRFWLISQKWPWPLLDSDEGTMGLMGMHILQGERPTFFYDQSYMGAAEAYLGAFMFHFFGISSFTLRLGMILLFTLFLLFMYLLTSLLFSKTWALIILILLALGSDAILTRELVAVGGDAETLVSGTLILLLATWLSLSIQDGSHRKRRLLAYAGCGLAAGFGVWSHLLVIPFILMGAILLVLFCRREIFNREVLKCFSWPLLTLIITIVIGAWPLIIYNIQNFWNPKANIFVVFWNLHRVSSASSSISSINPSTSYYLTRSETHSRLAFLRQLTPAHSAPLQLGPMALRSYRHMRSVSAVPMQHNALLPILYGRWESLPYGLSQPSWHSIRSDLIGDI